MCVGVGGHSSCNAQCSEKQQNPCEGVGAYLKKKLNARKQ